MISEEEVLLALPEQGYLRNYVQYAWWCSDVHGAFHILGGLAHLSQVVPVDYSFPFGVDTHTTLYGLSVGPSGDRKSHAITIARDILEAALPGCIGETPGSPESLPEQLGAMPRLLFLYPEFGKFLADTAQGYLNRLRTTLTDLWDGLPLGRNLVSKKGQKTEVKTPRVSILGGSTLNFLEDYTTATDWQGGFMARFLTFSAQRQRFYEEPPSTTDPVSHAHRRAHIIRHLQHLSLGSNGMGGAAKCMGFNREARDLWKTWLHQLEGMKANVPDGMRALVARAHGHAQRVAMLLAWDYGGGRTPPPGPGQVATFYVTPQELMPAIRIINLYVKSVFAIGDHFADGKDMQDRRKVLNQIQKEPRPLGEIIRRSQLLKDRVTRIIETLIAEGTVTRSNGAGYFGEWYRLTTPEEEWALYRGPGSLPPPQAQQAAGPLAPVIPISTHPSYWSSVPGVAPPAPPGVHFASAGSGNPNSSPSGMGGGGSGPGWYPEDDD